MERDHLGGFARPPGYPDRAVRNAFLGQWQHREAGLRAARPEEEKAFAASDADDLSVRAMWAGEGVDLIGERLPAADIVECGCP